MSISSTNQTDVAIAGGGVAGLEALLALRSIAGDRVRLTLIAPDPDFSYRPLAVAEPFALGHAHRVPLARFAEDTHAELVIAAVNAVDDATGELRLRDGGMRRFDALVVAPGGRAVAGVEGRRPGGRAATPRPTAACCATSTRATPSGSRSWSQRARSGRSRRTSWR